MAFIITGFLVLSGATFAQEKKDSSSSSLLSFLRKGKFQGSARTFFMSTINEGSISDYYAVATGAGIAYQSAEWKGLSVGMSGFFIFNVASAGLLKTDAVSQQKNRYEIGLFDITNPSNKYDLDRMEELYLKYRYKKTELNIGRQFITTPFINKQDGRMRPTIVEGIYLKSKINDHWAMEAGWLSRMSPRTTVSWFSIAESIGVYSPGVNTDGTKSDYPGNTKSKGVAITGVRFKNNWLQLQAWNTYVDNIMNTVLVQPDILFPANKKNKMIAGLQYIYQHGMGNGGHPDDSKRYYEKGSHTWVLGSSVGYEANGWKTHFNYLHISKSSRFLMPREWGREPFYTFLSRERNEGLGGVDAWTVNNEFTTKNKQWKWGLSYGRYHVPHPRNYRLNKYGLPSYQQVNASADYYFKGFLKNMEIQLLLVWKGNIEKESISATNRINRVNMLNSNLVINYTF